MGEIGRWQAADEFIRGTIKNKLHFVKHTRLRKRSLLLLINNVQNFSSVSTQRTNHPRQANQRCSVLEQMKKKIECHLFPSNYCLHPSVSRMSTVRFDPPKLMEYCRHTMCNLTLWKWERKIYFGH